MSQEVSITVRTVPGSGKLDISMKMPVVNVDSYKLRSFLDAIVDAAKLDPDAPAGATDTELMRKPVRKVS